MEYDHEKIKCMLENWGERVIVAIDSHYFCSRYYARRNYMLGVPSILLSAAVGSGILSLIDTQLSSYIKITLGLLSIFAALLSALHTFFRYSERSEAHKSTASKYSAVKREIEQLLTARQLDTNDIQKDIELIRKKLDDLSLSSPRIPDGVWEKTRIKHGRTFPIFIESDK